MCSGPLCQWCMVLKHPPPYASGVSILKHTLYRAHIKAANGARISLCKHIQSLGVLSVLRYLLLVQQNQIANSTVELQSSSKHPNWAGLNSLLPVSWLWMCLATTLPASCPLTQILEPLPLLLIQYLDTPTLSSKWRWLVTFQPDVQSFYQGGVTEDVGTPGDIAIYIHTSVVMLSFCKSRRHNYSSG